MRLLPTIILGILSMSTVLAQDEIIKSTESTLMDAPIIGKITTDKTVYVSDCRILEDRTMKFHNILARVFTSDPTTRDVTLTDLCTEMVWEIDHDEREYEKKTLAEMRAAQVDEDHETEINLESDKGPPIITQVIGREKEKVNGFKARKVTTAIRSEDSDNPLVIVEWYARKVPGMEQRARMFNRLDVALGRDDGIYHGVPDFIGVLFDELKEEKELETIPGYIIRAQIRMEDDDGDAVFLMEYNLLGIEELDRVEDIFSVPREYQPVN